MSEKPAVTREKEHQLRSLLYQLRSEPALRALVELQEVKKEAALRNWRSARTLEEHVRFQTEYNTAQSVIDSINTSVLAHVKEV